MSGEDGKERDPSSRFNRDQWDSGIGVIASQRVYYFNVEESDRRFPKIES